MFQLLYILLTQMPVFGLVYQKAFEKPLSKMDEENLIAKMLEGDQIARNKLICHNLRLVAHIAKKYENSLDDQEDLISIGTIGLMKAIDTFTNDKQTKLSTYAARCISNEILMHLRTNKKRALDVSLEDQIANGSEENNLTINDLVYKDEENIIDYIERKDNIEKMKKYLSILEKRELEIIELRYGINHHTALTQKQIAKKFNISRSYVSRIEKRALMKLYKEFTKTN